MKPMILWNRSQQATFYRILYGLIAGFLIAVGVGMGLVL